MSEVVVVAGMSGAGRSTAGDNLEDLGWFVMDNLPPALIPKVAELADGSGTTGDRLALVVGTGRQHEVCLLYTSPSPRDATLSRMPSSA